MTTEEKPDNRCAVDIRIFFLAIITSMTCAFLAGIWYVPPQALAASLHLYFTKSHRQLTKPRSLELSKADLYKSSKYSPSGQHILVDIEGVDSDFLDSEERLSNAMVQTVQQAGLTMLSYHCHKLSPAGISCVGVLLESHISFHTWPEEGVITLDLFTCGAKPLLPVVPVMEDLFGIGENAKAKWSHELRGFRSMEEKRANYLDNLSDLSMWVLSPVEIHTKKMIYSNLTKYQRVDIWDLTEVSVQIVSLLLLPSCHLNLILFILFSIKSF
jgi:S-adenosylmethionine decarboxylase proenzyme